MKNNDEFYVSVDIETSGPIPGEFSMLSIGACLVSNPKSALYLTLQPDSLKYDPEALAVSGFDLEALAREGLSPLKAMSELDKWLTSLCPFGKQAIFVGLNAPFDWSFVNYYFHKYLGRNPFGFTALDIKAYFMGTTGSQWKDTKSSHMTAILKPCSAPSHNALDDARFQAELFALMLANCDNTKRSPHYKCG
ncbi:3'-5' exonuclease [Serratia marcescens]|uniref:3'-5' exonuclease n=1 Tax=Serratia marcescens TaxID=615 RepID=UPI00124A654A|nr:exonuclease domain-containing protein [Serratia marcescens]KAB1579186.1 3'-5' exonuclease [Serratia marcescens]